MESTMPSRPYVPPTACAAAGALTASAVLLESAWRAYVRDGAPSVAGGALAGYMLVALAALLPAAGALGVAAHMRRRRDPRTHAGREGPRFAPSTLSAMPAWVRAGALFGLGMALACISCCAWATRMAEDLDAARGRAASSYVVRVDGDPSVNAFGASNTVGLYDAERDRVATARMTAERPFEHGCELEVVGRVEPMGADGWARSRFMRGETVSLDVAYVRTERDPLGLDPIAAVRQMALARIEPARDEGRALVAGIVCGRTTELNQTGAQDAFARTGLSHLVAVSGSHLAFIALLLQVLLRLLPLPRPVRTAILVATMAVYVLFTGAVPSAVRSVAMVAFGMAATLGRRRAHALSGLALTATALALIDPGIVFDLGFQLSALSVLFILLFTPYVTHLMRRLGLPRGIAAALGMTLVAQWATLPVTMPVFGELSLIAPVANLLAGPLMSALLVVGLVCVPIAVAAPALGPWALLPADALARASIFLARALASVPYASIPVEAKGPLPFALYGAAVAVYLLWREWSRAQLVGALLACLLAAGGHIARWTLLAPAAVTVLDVGQADAILVRDGAHTLLVDAGVDEEALAALARNHVFRLDAVLITHWDRDHWGGLPDILDVLPVGTVYLAQGAAGAVPEEVAGRLAGKLCEVRAGDCLEVGGFSCGVVWPRGSVAGDANGDSVCLDVTYDDGTGRMRALLTGDAECEEVGQIAGDVGDIDVLKVGHHGSAVSVDAEMLAALRPELALASAGEGNAYGHPAPACVETLEDAGALFACTKDCGDLSVRPARDGVRLTAACPDGLKGVE